MTWSWCASAELDSLEQTASQWLAILCLSFTKVSLCTLFFYTTQMPLHWQVWWAFYVSFWAEQTPRHSDLEAYSAVRKRNPVHQREHQYKYYSRMLLFSVLVSGLMWVFGMLSSMDSWFVTLIVYTLASFVKYFIDTNRVGWTWWRSLNQAARVTLGLSIHVTFSCFVATEVALAGTAQQPSYARMAFVAAVALIGRHVLRLFLAKLFLDNLERNLYSIHAYMAVTLDLGWALGLYLVPDLTLTAWLLHAQLLTDAVVCGGLRWARRDGLHRVAYDPGIEIWIHAIGLMLALPIDLHGGGLLAFYYRVLLFLYAAILRMYLATTVRWIQSKPTVGKANLTIYSTILLQTASTSFALLASLVSVLQQV